MLLTSQVFYTRESKNFDTLASNIVKNPDSVTFNQKLS
jgi:hypothetical protein